MKTKIKLIRLPLLFCIVFSFAILSVAQNVETEISPKAKSYLNAALDVLEKNSLLKKEVNWKSLRLRTLEKAAGAQETIDTWNAIRFALGEIGDNHSFLQLNAELQAKENERRKITKQKSAEIKYVPLSPYAARRTPEGFLHKSGKCTVGRLVVPTYLSQQGDDFATLLNKFIAETDGENVCGWIVDLRGNGGGNIFPMLAGVGALLDDGDASFALDADERQTAFFYRNGQSGLREPNGKETIVAKINGAAYKVKKQQPVAVLIDKGTASSGEGIAIAFRGREQTRFFGVPTYGISTSNEGFLLDDGANIVLTTGVAADKKGTKYFSGITPDEKIADSGEAAGAENDPVIQTALGWLIKQ
jgi:carboxyl-terminal processing protease